MAWELSGHWLESGEELHWTSPVLYSLILLSLLLPLSFTSFSVSLNCVSEWLAGAFLLVGVELCQDLTNSNSKFNCVEKG